MSKTYKLTPSFFATFQNRYYLVAIPLVLFMFFAIFLISVIGSEIKVSTIAVGLILLLFVISSLFKSLTQQKKIWASYLLIVDTDSIRRVQDTSATIEILRNEISKIKEYPDGNIFVESSISKKGILIPSTIEEYSEIRILLSKWHEIEFSKSNRKLNIAIAIILVILASVAMRMFYTGDNKITSIVIGVILLIIFTGTAIYAYNKSVDKRAKRVLWWFLLPILGITMRLYTLVFSK